jgi:phosphoglycerate transporter family protein
MSELLQTPPAAGRGASKGGLWKFFAPAPPAPITVTDPEQLRQKYSYWQNRILVSSLIGYAIFYVVRKNLSIALPLLEKDLGISKTDLGMFLTLHGILYGLSKFAHGFVADRANARALMVTGLLLSVLANVFFGFSSAVLTLGLFWVLNGWFQGIGFPPCARLMTHWFPPRELATKMSVWNTSHSIGALVVALLCGQLITRYQDWRLCFWVPAFIGLVAAVFLWLTLRDTPRSLGLPEVEGTQQTTPEGTETTAEFKAIVRTKVFGNPYIWLIALANFFVYTIRYAFFDWGTTLLKEFKGMDIGTASALVALFELFGVIGMLLCGWLTDKLFGGRGGRLCVFSMLLAGAAIYVFWRLPADATLGNMASFSAIGFFIYGPQALVGIAVANLATKRAAASAVGLTGIFGYASTVLSGWGVGKLAHQYGWSLTFQVMLAVAAIGTILFALTWKAKANGYEDAS